MLLPNKTHAWTHAGAYASAGAYANVNVLATPGNTHCWLYAAEATYSSRVLSRGGTFWVTQQQSLVTSQHESICDLQYNQQQ
jgi:hypothetical protein